MTKTFLDETNKNANTELHIASQKGELGTVINLLKNGADVDKKTILVKRPFI